MPNLAELVLNYQSKLHESDSALLDIELLLAHVLDKDRSYIKAFPEIELDDDQSQQFIQLIGRRIKGEPIAYILGSKGFWTLDLSVSEHTLIPRPETELLVETAIELITDGQARVLDLGTGTGAIALALAAERPSWQITACDMSAEAVALARDNAKRCGLSHVEILQSNWFAELKPCRYGLIVSNTPYIAADDPHLSQGDLRFEPHTALVSADKGLSDIKHIIQRAPDFLFDGGWLALEHGYNQGASTRQLLQDAGFSQVKTLTDLAGVDRVSIGQWLLENEGIQNG